MRHQEIQHGGVVVLPGVAERGADGLAGDRVAQQFSHFLEIDVTGLTVVQGRPGVFVVPNTEPLDLSGRIVRSGRN
ncbi:HYD1 signature containing ADP-ribosyltransferase family protein [Nocardia brasiliensis]|uniref:HYD1 signature containing ADP-ribosyltransferase family protein n=1 Tax=Nocardia brasiliensis TaxID=37326 RepID=UPI00193428AE